MSTINSATFNAGSGGVAGVYAPGDDVELTINYQADVPSVVPATVTTTINVINSGGTVTATDSPAFTVNLPQAGGDTVTSADDHSDTYTAGATTANPDGSLSVTFSTTAPSA